QIAQSDPVDLLKGRPFALVEPVRIEQPIAGRVLPFILAVETDIQGSILGNILFLLAQVLKVSLGRIGVGFRVESAQAMSGAGPKATALIFTNSADAGAGQAFLTPIFQPRAFGKTIEAAIGGDPD